MNTSKHVVAGFCIGLLLAMAPACGPAKVCNASTCPTGCCDASGTCQSSSQTNCGQLGQSCQQCGLGQSCNFGTCTGNMTGFGGGVGTTGGGSGTTGGGSSTTGGGDGTTGGGSATTGGGNGTTGGGSGTTGGGSGTTGGGSGTTGGGTGTCEGCIDPIVGCVLLSNSNTARLCGRDGVACQECTGATPVCQQSSRTCVANGTGGGSGTTGGGSGTTGGGSGTTGGGTGTTGGGTGTGNAVVGTPCTNNTQCAGLSGGYCKTQTTPFSGSPTQYPSGFCTVNCTSTCPGGSVCAGGVSSWPYLFNEVDRMCVPSCTQAAQCASGFECVHIQALTATTAVGGCWMQRLPTNYRGGGSPTKVGNTCTTTTDCMNPPDPILAVCATAFPNGYCLADSNYAPVDSWCTGAGKTEIQLPTQPDGGIDFYCAAQCPTPGAVGSSRPGYTCYRKSASEPTVGVLWPKCETNADCGGSAPVCNTTSGFCCDTATGTTNCAFDFM